MGKAFQLWPRLSWRRKAKSTPAPAAAPSYALCKLEKVNYVFGMDWRLVPPNRRLSRVFALARAEGQVWCAQSEMEDVVGFLPGPQWLRGPHYSASLHLASRYSQGGLELFAFALAPDRHAVLALQESRPLPGFDFLGDANTARDLIDEFLAIQRGQPMRLVGNLDDLEGLEQVSPEDIFAEPLKSARLRSLRSWRAVRRGLVFAVLATAVGVYLYQWLEQRRQQTLNELQASPAYQQNLYQQGLRTAWAALPASADGVLHDWYALLIRLPLRVQGWRLSHVACEIGQCLAHWQRQHGSYTDFLQHLPMKDVVVDDGAFDKSLMGGQIVTRHALPSTAHANPLEPGDLPELRKARRALADQLQDLELLGPSATKVEPAQLFGGQQDPEQLVDAVFSGQWSLQHALWVLPSLSLPPFVRVQSLRVHLQAPTGTEATKPSGPDGVAPPGAPPDASGGVPAASAGALQGGVAAKTGEPFFELRGSYYAQK